MCSVKDAFEYTFEDAKVEVWCSFSRYVGNGFFMVHFEFIFVVNGVSNANVPVLILYGVMDSWI